MTTCSTPATYADSPKIVRRRGISRGVARDEQAWARLSGDTLIHNQLRRRRAQRFRAPNRLDNAGPNTNVVSAIGATTSPALLVGAMGAQEI